MKVKSKNMVFSNVVKKEQLREVQKNTLADLKQSLMLSAGPFGSTTGINRKGEFTEYTKDGHTILGAIQYNRAIEASIQQELSELTRYIVVKVGDGTTSAVILSSLIFDELCALEVDKTIPPYKIIEIFKNTVGELKKLILEEKRDLTLEDVYNISMICTNNNKDISDVLSQIYEKHGLDVFIDVAVSNTSENLVKSYDGLTIECGYADPAYINIAGKGSADAGLCVLKDVSVYAFQDPIDTIEMTDLFVSIIKNNIMTPLRKYEESGLEEDFKAIKPTVIMAPKISVDNSTVMTDLASFMYQYGPDSLDVKPPLLVITNIGEVDYEIYSDMWRLCGCKPIKKYIDHDIQKKEIEEGKAPTVDTICTFCGHAEQVKADQYKSTFINPKDMFATVKDGEEKAFSPVYMSQLNFIQQQLNIAESDSQDASTIYNLKRRLHSLKANMVDYFIGGATVTDRDSVRALVEDAVKNIRSASQNGVGYGANYEGLRAAYKYLNTQKDPDYEKITQVIFNAYMKLSHMLYETAMGEVKAIEMVHKSIVDNCGPINLVNGTFDGMVLSTIDSDTTILDVISRILTIMFTTNQFLVLSPAHNMYLTDVEEF